ncbi:hypothetical protein CLOSTASPAR_06820 [[Clostridium] asparagiforme DSM 15981]|uniref:Uncharacterized protein n=1 Tax=[Clostridium] asparagiforme DSM 15981 TaxID=518636 RepID=C0DC13_9FIRM|nr:hypothetical protein CLOSTASPAR_06820 [[Clostridium] asparagiforme DSM 15981]
MNPGRISGIIKLWRQECEHVKNVFAFRRLWHYERICSSSRVRTKIF